MTAADEDYSYAEVDEKLKKLQTALRHNQTGALPRLEAERSAVLASLQQIELHQRRLAELEAALHELKAQRAEIEEILSGLDALDKQARLSRVTASETALAEARADREAWQTVCADLPDEDLLQDLEAELQQIQRELQETALKENSGTADPALPPPDPVFGRMEPREAHDKAAADAIVSSSENGVCGHVDAHMLHGAETAYPSNAGAVGDLCGDLLIRSPLAIERILVLGKILKNLRAGSTGIGRTDLHAGLIGSSGNSFIAGKQLTIQC